MANIVGKAIDWAEAIAEAEDDPESRAAGCAEPGYAVSEKVSVSRDHSLYVYHLPDDQLGQGSSLGNARCWAETKGNGDMLRFYSIEKGEEVFGGMSVTYMLPFTDLSTSGSPASEHVARKHDKLSRAMPSSIGSIHLHPAFQQREFVIGDGLHVLETFFVPRTGMDDPAAAHEVVLLRNETPHPISITIVASIDLRGHTQMDLKAEYDTSRGAIICWNDGNPDFARVFGSPDKPVGYWATTDQEEVYSPGERLRNLTDETGNLTGALQFDVTLLPNQQHKLKVTLAFSPRGREEALRAYDVAVSEDANLKQTIGHIASIIERASVEMPDDLLTHGVQWAKVCFLRPMARYPIGDAFTNDPGKSSNLVGRDSAWFIHGADFVNPEWSCSLLRIFTEHQRENGLIPEWVNGISGESEDFGFNINDNTPLYVMAVGHHIKVTGHRDCLDKYYEPAKKAAELILQERDGRGLVKCNADGKGARGICGWRNVLENQRINGVVTELNSECYAALCAVADLAEMAGNKDDSKRFGREAVTLRNAINEHLINPENGLYVLNIDLEGHVFTQATSDLVFPLICGVSDEATTEVVSARLAEHDFMTAAGIRVLPSENPHYDPSFESGCMGGVWPGVTWWYAMGSSAPNPKTMAEALRRAYSHYVADPKVYNTVPGQFSEWSDGQTLVNRGMRLSPWEPPRYLWAAIEGLAGIKMGIQGITLEPRIPPDWLWLKVHDVPYRDGKLSYFLAREADDIHVYTINTFGGGLRQHRYEEAMEHGAETISTGISASVYKRGNEILMCLGSRLEQPALGPFLAHHSIEPSKKYDIWRLNSHEREWRNIGEMSGDELQRIAVRVERRGYVLYKFISGSK